MKNKTTVRYFDVVELLKDDSLSPEYEAELQAFIAKVRNTRVFKDNFISDEAGFIEEVIAVHQGGSWQYVKTHTTISPGFISAFVDWEEAAKDYFSDWEKISVTLDGETERYYVGTI